MKAEERLERNKMIVQLHRKGSSIDEIKKHVTIGGRTIWKILKTAGINLPIPEANNYKPKMTYKERKERRQLIRQLYADGKNEKELCERFNLNPSYILHIITTHDDKVTEHMKEVLKRNELIINEYKEGKMSTVQIGKKHGVDHSTVFHALKLAGIKPEKKIKQKERNKRIKEMFADGIDVKKIAEQFNLNALTILRIARKQTD